MRAKLLREREQSKQNHDVHSAWLDEENEMMKHISPIDPLDAQKYRDDYVPHVQNGSRPASDKIPQSPDQQMRYNQEEEYFEMKSRPAIPEETKKEIAEKHTRYPGVFNHKMLAKTYGLSADEIHTILFEHELKHKYKMFTPNEVALMRDAPKDNKGENKQMEKHAYLMNAYSEILSERTSKWMPHGPRSDIEHQEGHTPPHEYYTKKVLKNTRRPFLRPEEAHTKTKEGPGSGQPIPCESWQISQPLAFPYLITDIQPKRKVDWRPKEVKVRERTGKLRWGNLDEVNWVKFKEMHPMGSRQSRKKNITTRTRLLFKGILEPLSYHYRKHQPLAAHEKVTRWHHWWGTF